MTEYLNKPRQGTFSENPIYMRKPRQYAKKRCENTLRAIERIVLYMGEVLTLFNTLDLRPDELCTEALNIVNDAMETGVSISDLIYALEENRVEGRTLGRYSRIVVLAAIVQSTANELQNTILELNKSI